MFHDFLKKVVISLECSIVFNETGKMRGHFWKKKKLTLLMTVLTKVNVSFTVCC